MKKNQKFIFIAILIIIITCIIGIKFIPFGNKYYKNDKMASILKIPRLSIFDEECCMFSAKFKSFRSSYSLKKELDDIMKSYEKTICDSKTYYYDKKHNITISDYGVESGIFINYFYIVYDKGNYKCDSTINKNLENVLANIKNNIPTNTND